MIVGDFGPVETEVIFTFLIASFGFLGPEFYQSKVSE